MTGPDPIPIADPRPGRCHLCDEPGDNGLFDAATRRELRLCDYHLLTLLRMFIDVALSRARDRRDGRPAVPR